MAQKGLLGLAVGYVTDMSLTLCRGRRGRRASSHHHTPPREIPEVLLCGCTADELCGSCALPTEGPLSTLAHA